MKFFIAASAALLCVHLQAALIPSAPTPVVDVGGSYAQLNAIIASLNAEHTQTGTRWAERVTQYDTQMKNMTARLDKLKQTLHMVQCGTQGVGAAMDAGRRAAATANRARGEVVQGGGLSDKVNSVDRALEAGERTLAYGTTSVHRAIGVGDCFTTPQQRADVRRQIENALARQDMEAAIEAIDATEPVIQGALEGMDARGKYVAKTYGNNSILHRDNQLVRAMLAQSNVRINRAMQMRHRQEEIEAKMTEVRKARSRNIRTVQGMLEALQLVVDMQIVQSEQFSAISDALNNQSRVLESMHSIAARQAEIESYRFAAEQERADAAGGRAGGSAGRSRLVDVAFSGDREDAEPLNPFPRMRDVEPEPEDEPEDELEGEPEDE